jgi:DNA-binding protein H-NS
MDLTKLSRQDLSKLKSDIERELKKRERGEKAAAKKKIQAIAQSAGFTVDELFDEKKPKAAKSAAPAAGKRAKAKVKYRDPKNAKNTWSGRGRMPKWLAAEIEKGKKKEDFAV